MRARVFGGLVEGNFKKVSTAALKSFKAFQKALKNLNSIDLLSLVLSESHVAQTKPNGNQGHRSLELNSTP